MKPKYLFLLAATGLLHIARGAAPDDDLVARGRHLVEHVALCGDCHAPRRPDGGFDRARWLQGAAIGFRPLAEMPWSPVAPPLAGAAYTDAHLVTLLTSGRRADGTVPLPPMPAFRLTPAEAQAVVAYLRSLAPAP